MNKKLTKIIKNLSVISLLVFFGFILKIKNVSADNYSYVCADGGTITSTVSISPSGPFPLNPNTFTAYGMLTDNSCTVNNVNLTVQNNSGTIYTIIPTQPISLNGQIPLGAPAYQQLTPPASAGNYAVHFVTGVNENGGGTYGGGFARCFVADTKVTMADGSKKNIQDVKIGDMLMSKGGNNKVLGFHQPKLGNQKLYSFNSGRYFVTAEHPFLTTDGWKSLDPEKTANEHLNINITALHVGDMLITDHGNVKLNSINGKYESSDTQLYNFILDGDHTYYADGYLVHNKVGCTADGSGAPNYPLCPSNIYCLDSTPPPTGALAYPPNSSNVGTCSIPCSVPESNPQAYCTANPGRTFCSTDLYMHNCP